VERSDGCYILAYTDDKKVAMSVGIYYMANACGRLAGTVFSGLLYQLGTKHGRTTASSGACWHRRASCSLPDHCHLDCPPLRHSPLTLESEQKGIVKSATRSKRIKSWCSEICVSEAA
jgi:hypothetical protein